MPLLGRNLLMLHLLYSEKVCFSHSNTSFPTRMNMAIRMLRCAFWIPGNTSIDHFLLFWFLQDRKSSQNRFPGPWNIVFTYENCSKIIACTQMERTTAIPTTEEWLVKKTELVKMVCFVRKETVSTIMDDWKSLVDFLHKKE